MEAYSRKLPNGGRDVGPGRKPGHDLFDLPFLLSAGRVEHLAVVRGRQVRREEPRRGQVDCPCRKQLEDDGVPSGGPCDLDPVVGLPLRKSQGIPAVDVKGFVSLAQVHIARVQLGEVRDEVGRLVTLSRDQALHARDELVIGEASERSENVVLHGRVVARASEMLQRTA